MKTLSTVFRSGPLALTLALICAPGMAATPSSSEVHYGPVSVAGYQLGIALDKTEFAVGEDVSAKIVLRNMTNRNLGTWLTDITGVDFDVLLRDAAGKDVPFTKEGARWHRYRGLTVDWARAVTLKPGGTFEETFPGLNRFYDLSSPGIYTLTASKGVPIDPTGRRSGWQFLQSGQVVLVIFKLGPVADGWGIPADTHIPPVDWRNSPRLSPVEQELATALGLAGLRGPNLLNVH